MKISDATDLFIGNYPNKGTQDAYRYPLLFLIRQLEDKAITEVSTVDMVRFSQAVEEQDWSPANKRKYQKSAKTFFNWLVKMELLIKSPAKIITPHRINTMIDRNKAMPDTDLRILLEHTKHQRLKRNYALICVLADTGIRAGGAARLMVEDVDFNGEIITVTEKGDKTRSVPIYPESIRAVRMWLLQRKPGAGPYLFTRDGSPIQSASISQIVSRACEAAGVDKHWGSHSLRHRKGKQTAAARVNPSVAAAALGQDVLTYLQHYVGVDAKAIRDALKDLALPSTPSELRIITPQVERKSG